MDLVVKEYLKILIMKFQTILRHSKQVLDDHLKLNLENKRKFQVLRVIRAYSKKHKQ